MFYDQYCDYNSKYLENNKDIITKYYNNELIKEYKFDNNSSPGELRGIYNLHLNGKIQLSIKSDKPIDSKIFDNVLILYNS